MTHDDPAAQPRSERPSVTWLLREQGGHWQRGDTVRVEELLQRHPDLLSRDETVLDLIYHEVVLREQSGESPKLGDYLERFPRFDRELRQMFEMHDALESADRTPSLPVSSMVPATLPASRPGPAVAWPAIAGYEILGKLGDGSMGVVYQARQVKLDRVVALKMVRRELHLAPKQLARFRTEVETVARLHHPNIVQLYDVGDHQGCPYFTMEFVDGGGLDRKLAGTPLPAEAAARLSETIARAVHLAHQQGIVHRDLKPANVVLTADGVPKITDFGLAKVLGREGGQTETGDLLGTPCYMAPEQAGGESRSGWPRGRPLCPGGHLVRIADRPAAVQGGDLATNRHPTAPRRPGPAGAAEFAGPARPEHDLPQMPGEGAA